MMIQRTLESEGYQVDAASDGNEAIARLKRFRYLMMITDLKLPGLDGMELLQAGLKEDPQLPVIVMTAYGTIDNAGGRDEAGRLRLSAQAVRQRPPTPAGSEGDPVSGSCSSRTWCWRRSTARGWGSRRSSASTAPSRRSAPRSREPGPRTSPSCSPERAEPERSCSPERFTSCHPAAGRPSLPSTVPRSPRPCSRTSCSVTRRARTPGPAAGASEGSSWRTVAPSCWTRSASWRRRSRRRSSGSSRRRRSRGWAGRRRSRSTSASSPPPTAISRRRWPQRSSGRTCSSGSTSSPSRSRRSGPRREDIPLLVTHFVEIYAREMKRGAMTVSDKAMMLLEEYRWPGNVPRAPECRRAGRHFFVLCDHGEILPMHINLPGDPRNRREKEIRNLVSLEGSLQEVSERARSLVEKVKIESVPPADPWEPDPGGKAPRGLQQGPVGPDPGPLHRRPGIALGGSSGACLTNVT